MNLLDGLMGALGGDGKGGLDLGGLASQLGNGGLDGIVGQLQAGGLGEAVQSWISTGHNLPVSAEQLQSVLGSEQVAGLARSLGIDTSQIASALPGLIDKLTPNGQLPQGNITDVLSQVAGSDMFKNILGGLKL
jgi:uncharacterized protein YidB (DUF937 family)